METVTGLLASNKILIIIAILIISSIIYYLFKGVFKIILIIVIALLLYSLYMNYNEKENFDSLQQHFDSTIKDLNEKKDKTNRIVDFIDKIIPKS